MISVMNELDGEANREQLQRALKLSDRKSFRSRYLLPALELGLIEMTLPDKPTSSLQKYRLTALGKKLLRSRLVTLLGRTNCLDRSRIDPRGG